MDGYEDGTFRPQQYITRAEAVTMVNRTIDRPPRRRAPPDGMITWSDNHEDAWYYEDVQEATNSPTRTPCTPTTSRILTRFGPTSSPVRDWAPGEGVVGCPLRPVRRGRGVKLEP